MNYPPQIPEDISMFEHGLKSVVPEKIEEVFKQMDELDKQYKLKKEAIKSVSKREGLDEATKYFWSLWTELEYKNYFILKKWLWYWINIWDRLPHKKSVIPDRILNQKMDLERIKQRPIEQFYEGKLTGSVRLMGKCPFHEERSPSFFIFTNTNTFHCFGCQEGGDVIDFVQKKFNVDFKEAVRRLE